LFTNIPAFNVTVGGVYGVRELRHFWGRVLRSSGVFEVSVALEGCGNADLTNPMEVNFS